MQQHFFIKSKLIKNITQLSLSLLVIIFLSGCFFFKKRHDAIKEEILETHEKNSQETYVTTYLVKVQKSKEAKQETFSLEKVNKARGYLKSPKGFNTKEINEEVYEVEFLDENKNIVSITTARNPLTKHFEAPNESGEIESKTVTVTEEIIGVRVNHNSIIVSMKFYKTIDGKRIFLQELALLQK